MSNTIHNNAAREKKKPKRAAAAAKSAFAFKTQQAGKSRSLRQNFKPL